MDPPSFLLHHRRLLLRPPPLPELYPGGAAASTTTSVDPPSSSSSSPSPSSPLLIPFFVVFVSLLFFLLGFLFHDIFSFLQSPSSSNKRKNGVNPSDLNSFPVMQYTEVLRNRFGVADCAVCLSEFEGGENVRVVTVCSHVFHAECIDFWLESHFTCPICRADLRNEDEERAASGVCQGASNG
ncbi:hypothetical protein LUZ60_014286 [Juncus effusus]|nr:hypothetical protein LUZ60_014286 [Juncus effusus]